MHRRLRVLMLGPGLGVRGGVSAVERHILTSLPADIEMRHIATMEDGSGARKIAVFGLALLRTLAALVTWRPDIAHLHFSIRASTVRKMTLANLSSAFGCRIILHGHGGGYHVYLAGLPRAARGLVLWTLRRARCVIALSEGWRAYYASILGPSPPVLSMPNPVAPAPERPPRAASGNTTTFVYLGLMDRLKGTFDLVDAVAGMPAAERAKLRVVIAGDGKVAEIREQVARAGLAGVIEVHDWLPTEAVERLFAAADALVLPSYFEGMPMGVLEAMSRGVPCICTPVGGVPEIVVDDRNGLLVEPGDLAALAVAMRRLAREPETRARLGAAARESVAPLDTRLYGRTLAALYRSIHEHGHPPAGPA